MHLLSKESHLSVPNISLDCRNSSLPRIFRPRLISNTAFLWGQQDSLPTSEVQSHSNSLQELRWTDST